MNFTATEIIDFINNKVQIDVRFLSDEEIDKTIEVFGCAVEMIEKVEQMQAELDILKAENDRLEKLVAINKGAMRAYCEACENAQDEAVKDFSHFLIDKVEGGSIEVADLPDLVAEWKSPSRKSEKVTNEINEALDKASATLRSGSLTGKGFYETRFERVE